MDAKWKSTMGTVMGVLAIPMAGLLLYGMYIVFTYKPKPKPPEPKIDTFRADGKPKGDDSTDVRDKKKMATKKNSGEPQVWDVELLWEVENADEITIDHGIGKVEAKGSTHVEIDKNTTYVMKAKNITGEVTYNLDVEVVPADKQD
jgi:hypothetical protein